MFPEEFSQKTLIGEVQFFGNLLDVLDGVLELHPKFKDDIIIDPLIGGAMTDGLYGFREILRCDVELLGVPAYTAFVPEVLLHKFDEPCEDNLFPRLGLDVILYPIVDVAQVVEHR